MIDACLQLRKEPGFAAAKIESIDFQVHPLVLELTGNKTPRTGLEGKFSVYHSAAVAIIHNAASPREFTDAVVQDARVVALRDRVHATASAMISEEQRRVTIVFRDGGRLEKFIQHAIGGKQNPMSDADLDQKFYHLAEANLPAQRLPDFSSCAGRSNHCPALAKFPRRLFPRNLAWTRSGQRAIGPWSGFGSSRAGFNPSILSALGASSMRRRLRARRPWLSRELR